MYELGNLAPKKSILVTDAGSNYYIGGQAWTFNKNQKEIASTSMLQWAYLFLCQLVHP